MGELDSHDMEHHMQLIVDCSLLQLCESFRDPLLWHLHGVLASTFQNSFVSRPYSNLTHHTLPDTCKGMNTTGLTMLQYTRQWNHK